MALNRRKALGAIGGLSLFGKGATEQIFNPDQSRPPSSDAFVGADGPSNSGQAQLVSVKPHMDVKTALGKLFVDKQFLEELRAELFENEKYTAYIDPDILVMKSFSPMAKLTFQRQRNVERRMKSFFDINPDSHGPAYFSDILAKRLRKMMWG